MRLFYRPGSNQQQKPRRHAPKRNFIYTINNIIINTGRSANRFFDETSQILIVESLDPVTNNLLSED